MEEDFGKEIAKEAAKALVTNMYADVKSWMTSLGHKVKKVYHNTTIKKFESPVDLIQAIQENKVQIGEQVRLKATLSPFGPFLRYHFLSPIVGHHTEQRVGPPLLSQNPILGIMAQATSHLMPVGLYPPIADGLFQACLYPPDVPACGFIGIFPGVNELVPYLHALVDSRFTRYYGLPSWVVGVVRYIDASTLVSAGFSLEDHEVIRQIGKVWFLDITGDDASIDPSGDELPDGLWGGLYASGHLEIVSGELKIKSFADAIESALSAEGFETFSTQNLAGRKELLIYSKGIRAKLDTIIPFYSIHMDAELAHDFNTYRQVFDSVTKGILKNIRDVCLKESVALQNDFDLDFSYTDSTKSYSVLKSVGADNINDPMAIAIRDWHRIRGL